jgi:3-oxoacyl-[acyl-carrier protein] reductase
LCECCFADLALSVENCHEFFHAFETISSLNALMIDLYGKTALVTGGSRGIGAAIVRTLAQAGASVAFTYRRDTKRAKALEAEVQSLGHDCAALQANVASCRDVRLAVARAISRFGVIDILVNNAGIWKSARLESMSEREWDETMNVNLKGTFFFCKEVAPHMKKRGGKIINIASTAGQRGEPFHSHYAASKGGIIAFTRSIAVELARFNIQVNCVSPGWVDTDMTSGVLGKRASRRAIEATIPRGRVATPEEVSESVLFLASSLSNHLVGSVISVNGGSVLSG